jgi:uncharacterized protein with NRDE domain
MCTLIAIHRRVAGVPLMVAANRDEYLDRPAEGPALRWTPSGPVVAPLDSRAGGTWLGLNGRGVFSALTNLRTPNPDPTRKSRGMVVLQSLESGSAEAAADALARLPRHAYNPFNCYVADAETAWLVVYEDEPRLHALDAGVHVIGNADAAAPAVPKIDRVSLAARRAAARPAEEILDALAEICREHGTGTDPLDDTCVHVADTYGTRSSLLLELADEPAAGRLLYADGPPCDTPYEDFSALLSELRQMPGYGSTELLARTVG